MLTTLRSLAPFQVLAVIALLSTFGCGSSTTTTGAGGPDGGAPEAGTTAAPSGTCRATLVDGTTQTTFEGTARAKMNGSGNLVVECGATSGDAELELDFGNATFDGPRTYAANDFSSDGAVSYAPTTRVTYLSSEKGSSCTLILTQAGPLDARGDGVVTGGTVAATFSCTQLGAGSATATPASYVVRDGVVSATVE